MKNLHTANCSNEIVEPKIALGKYLANAIFGQFYFITAIWLIPFFTGPKFAKKSL
jgi:hypothetical protein